MLRADLNAVTRLTLTMLCAAAVLGACEIKITSRMPELPCPENGQCLAGFACDPGKNVCAALTGAVCSGEGREFLCSRAVGACSEGRRLCKGGFLGECSGSLPQPERCDGRDDDCDGETDEGFADLGEPCTVGIGACAVAGTRVCAPDGSGTVCDAQPAAPALETCNGRDDDCDGLVDNNPTDAALCPLQLGVCAGAREACTAGRLVGCSGVDSYGAAYDPTPTERLCDGLDNDCDGQVDEGYVPQPGDVVVNEVVACPAQAWGDGVDPVTLAVPEGGNGVPFDDVPATGDLDGAQAGQHTWLELRNTKRCAFSLDRFELMVGAAPGALSSFAVVARDPQGGDCATLEAEGLCVVKGPLALRGSDGSAFTRVLAVRDAASQRLIDERTFTSPACSSSCRLANARRTGSALCCEDEAMAVRGDSVVRQAATPLWPNDIRDRYRAPAGTLGALGTEVRVSEVLGFDGGALDANGDATSSASEDSLLEVAALPGRLVDLGRARLVDGERAGDRVLHHFACFAPIGGERRAVVFGGARAALAGPALAAVSSRGPNVFALPAATALNVGVETASGQGVCFERIGAEVFTGARAQSRERCQPTDDALSDHCACVCSASSCAESCAAACSGSVSSADDCTSPGVAPEVR